MRKVRRTLPVVLPALAILGLLAVSSQARRPTPPPPTIQVVGGIKILPNGTTTDPTNVRVQFDDESFVTGCPLWAGKSFPANADRSPALYTVIMRAGPPDTLDRRLRFYFCAHPSHTDQELRCQDPTEHSDYYYCLNLLDGQTTGKGRGDLNHLTYPPGTFWNIGKKVVDGSTVPQGNLVTETTYDVTE